MRAQPSNLVVESEPPKDRSQKWDLLEQMFRIWYHIKTMESDCSWNEGDDKTIKSLWVPPKRTWIGNSS
jgi:hypothetical protein